MTDDVKKGKKQVVIVISILLTVSILSNLFASNIPMFLGTVTLCGNANEKSKSFGRRKSH